MAQSSGRDAPLGRLATPLVNIGLLGLLAESRRAVRVLFAHRLPVRQILRAVAHHDKRANLRTVDSHVGEDASGVRDRLLLFGRHCVEQQAGAWCMGRRGRVRDKQKQRASVVRVERVEGEVWVDGFVAADWNQAAV